MRILILLSVLFWHQQSFAVNRIVITGSSTIAPVISDIAKLYEKDHQEVRIDVQTGGSSRGILDARKGLAQISMVSRALKEREHDLHGFTIAKDGLAVIVHKSNPIQELSRQQIRDIYTGKIKNWREVGGDDRKIVVVNKAEGRSTLELFLAFFDLKNSQIKADVVIGDNEQGIKTVSGNRFAVGYVSVGAAEYNASVGVPLKLLSFEGSDANVSNVASGGYPLMRELNLVTKEEPQGAVKDFLSFVLSKNSAMTIREHYFVPTSKE